MKRIQKIAAVLAAVAMLVLLPEASAFPAFAEEPVTYAVKYVSEETGWLYQPNTSTYDDSVNGHSIDNLLKVIKDGDLVVIYNDLGANKYLDLGNVKLSNLTYVEGAKWSMVFAGSVQDCYVLGGSTGTVNCDVENAYVYDTVVFNFNGNVKEMTVYAADKVQSSIGCEGTVGHLYGSCTTMNRTFFDLYDFAAGALFIQDGILTPKGSYKSAEEHAAELAAAPTAAPPAPENTPAPAPSDEYDDVPKTGQSNLYLWLLFASVVCFVGSRALKRSSK